jgi:hypothetical protein
MRRPLSKYHDFIVKRSAVCGSMDIYPLPIHIRETPKSVEPDIEYLQRVVHSMDIVPDGMSTAEYVDQLRHADETEKTGSL